MQRRHFRPQKGDPVVDFVDDCLQSIEDMRYQLRVLKSDLIVIRAQLMFLKEEHDERIDMKFVKELNEDTGSM